MTRESDLSMLKELLEEHLEDLSEPEVEAFASMRFDLTAYTWRPNHKLTVPQREWVTRVYEKIVPQYSNLISQGLAPRGREVELMVKDRPLRPPGRR